MTVDGSRRGEHAMLVVAVVLIAIAACVLMATAAGDGRIADASLDLGWLWLNVAFGACETFPLRVERRQGEHFDAEHERYESGAVHHDAAAQQAGAQQHSRLVGCLCGEDESPGKAAADNHELREQRKTVDADFFGQQIDVVPL